MIATDILSVADANAWLRLDDSEPVVGDLIQAAYDVADDSIDDFELKLKSAKFKRKLKLFMLNYVVSAYDKRGLEDDSNGKVQFVNATLMMQLQYGTYLETDT